MRETYILNYKTTDSMGRAKTTKLVGVYATIEQLEKAQALVLEIKSNVVFTVHTSEHILFE